MATFRHSFWPFTVTNPVRKLTNEKYVYQMTWTNRETGNNAGTGSFSIWLLVILHSGFITNLGQPMIYGLESQYVLSFRKKGYRTSMHVSIHFSRMWKWNLCFHFSIFQEGMSTWYLFIFIFFLHRQLYFYYWYLNC